MGRMRRGIPITAAALLLVAGAAHGFCVENAVPDRAAQSALALPRPQPPQKLYEDTVAPGKQSCCNPRNFECNPTRVGDADLLPFEARIDASPPLACGSPPGPARPRVVEVPARGLLRFEPNAQFDPGRPADAANPPYLLRSLGAQRDLLRTYPCAP